MPVIRINEILERLQAYRPQADIALVQKAYIWSAKLHKGSLRKSGLPYLSHPLEVTGILTELRLQETALAAGLLHDVIEDTFCSREKLEAEFGREIARLVDGVTKIGQVTKNATDLEVKAETYRKMILAMAQDMRVILIKLADRLHNMRTLEFHDEDKRLGIAQETLEIYAPIAARLGIHWIQAELEDLCLQHLKPDLYFRLASQVAQVREARHDYIIQVQTILRDTLAEAGIEATVTGRFKHLYSIYQKMEKQRLSFEEIHDLMAFRIIVPTINACYDAVRVIHSLWKPVPKRFKDYVALPKTNMYKSLHTTLIGPEGRRIEIQIRTPEMHAVAEYGIAAHWRYKQEGVLPASAGEKKTPDFIANLLEYQQEVKSPDLFLETLKAELTPTEIIVFTPKGDLYELPAGATPVDFAYAIHSELGHHCAGAKVNGKIVPLNHPLQSGDTVEILTSQTVTPARAWLDFVKTPRARTKINHWLSLKETERARELGRQMLETQLLRYGRPLGPLLESGELDTVAKLFSFASAVKLLEALGGGKFSVNKVLARLVDPAQLRRKPSPSAGRKTSSPSGQKNRAKTPAKTGKTKTAPAAREAAPREDAEPSSLHSPAGILIKSLDDPLLPLAACCNPIPGDEVTAVQKESGGLEIHRRLCPQVQKVPPGQLLPAAWAPRLRESATAVLEIVARDQPGLLSKISADIAAAGINISRALVHTTEDQKAILSFHLPVKNLSQLNRLIKAIEKNDNVLTVKRL